MFVVVVVVVVVAVIVIVLQPSRKSMFLSEFECTFLPVTHVPQRHDCCRDSTMYNTNTTLNLSRIP